MSKRRDIISTLILICSIPLFAYSLYRIYAYDDMINRETSYAKELQNLAPEKTDNSQDYDIHISDSSEFDGIFDYEEPREIQHWAKELLARNSETVGWIRIPGFTDSNGQEYINYPVMQGDDNEYYLSHNLDKEYYYSGSAFADCYSKIDENGQPNNIVIYGHNMRTLGTAFTHLNEYKQGADFLKKYPIIEFNTIYDEGPEDYAIISCYVAAANEFQDDDVFYYWRYHYFDDKKYKFDYWLNKTLHSSWCSCDIKCDEDDQYITLSTCSNEVRSMRWVITAKKLDKDDDREKILDSYKDKDNSDIYFPRYWRYAWGNNKKYLGWNY